MTNRNAAYRLYGTDEPTPGVRTLTAGALTVDVEDGALRSICWHGIEAVRGIMCLVRDAAWRTLAVESPTDRWESDEASFVFERRFSAGDGALDCGIEASGSAGGVLAITATIEAQRRFVTNRAGLTLLHPIRVAGEALTVRHPDGTETTASFPERISPGQPALDIAGLAYRVGPVRVDVAFEGEVFEMEDQRNWSDASFKTYCRSLFRPYPYEIPAGTTVSQGITIGLSGAGNRTTGKQASVGRIAVRQTKGAFPEIGLVLEHGWMTAKAGALVVETGIKLFQVRVSPMFESDFLPLAATAARECAAEIDLEVVVPDGTEQAEALGVIAIAAKRAEISPQRVLALPASYLKSYQPTDVWPEGPGPAECASAARSAFPDAAVGQGALTNFTEFNRHPPDATGADFVSHGITAIVHAADDRSVVETLETLPQIFRSARALAAGKPYRLGLVAIGMRSNPYGSDVAANPQQVRRTMARIDPRQRGLFAAAWAVAATAAAANSAVGALALAAPIGPFGVIHDDAPWPQPIFDGDETAVVFPLFHAVRGLARLRGSSVVTFAGLPAAVHGVGGGSRDGARLILAHTGDGDVTVSLPGLRAARILGIDSFDAAIRDPRWLDSAAATDNATIKLGSYATAFIDIDRVPT